MEDKVAKMQEELMSSKEIINWLIKDIAAKDANLENHVRECSQDTNGSKYPSWSEVVNGKKNQFKSNRQIELETYRTTANQCGARNGGDHGSQNRVPQQK
jgi:hypothetical protein